MSYFSLHCAEVCLLVALASTHKESLCLKRTTRYAAAMLCACQHQPVLFPLLSLPLSLSLSLSLYLSLSLFLFCSLLCMSAPLLKPYDCWALSLHQSQNPPSLFSSIQYIPQAFELWSPDSRWGISTFLVVIIRPTKSSS